MTGKEVRTAADFETQLLDVLAQLTPDQQEAARDLLRLLVGEPA